MGEHFDSKAEAVAYEAERSSFNRSFAGASVIPIGPDARVIEIFHDGQPATFRRAPQLMEQAPLHTRLVLENGQVWEKTVGPKEDSWRLMAGKPDRRQGFEVGKSYNGRYLRWLLKDTGGRLEIGGRRREMLNTDPPNIAPANQKVAVELNEAFHSVTGFNAIIKQQNSKLLVVSPQKLTKAEVELFLKSRKGLSYEPADLKRGRRDEHFVYWPR